MAYNKKSGKKNKKKPRSGSVKNNINAYKSSNQNNNKKSSLNKSSGKNSKKLSQENAQKNKNDSAVKINKKNSGLQEKIIIVASIVVGVAIIAVMVLNIPIIEMNKVDRNGSEYTEYVSILEWVKSSQPMIDKDGALSRDTNSYELASNAENIDDKRDFTNDQIIEGQFTVLCLGFDESRELSDVIMLFQFDIINDKINILQIPRDSYVPDYTQSDTSKLNSVYMHGDESLKPIQRVVDAVRDTFGIPIDRYITTGCDDIVDMVDLIGGIPIELPEEVFYSYDKILPAGEYVLNGKQAEILLRARAGYDEGDIGRVKAQRRFLAAAMEKALNMGNVKLIKFLSEVHNKGYIGTDMTLQEMSILADFGSNMNLKDVTVHMVPGEGTDYNGYSMWSIHKNATVDLLNKYFRPYQTDLSYDSLPIVEIIEKDSQLTNVYDKNEDTLQEIADGAVPGENKMATEKETQNESETEASGGGRTEWYDNGYDDENYGY